MNPLLFFPFSWLEIPAETAETLHRLIGQKLENSGLYSKVLSDDSLNALLTQKSDLTQAKDIYLDTLAVVLASDKDISNPLGNYLQVKNFLIFQVDRWPFRMQSKQRSSHETAGSRFGIQ
jgi:hypothetical protein